MPNYKILISDGLDSRGQSILRSAAEVDVHDKLPADDLVQRISEYDALIVRGQTRVTAAVLDAASRLKVVWRAGVGVTSMRERAGELGGTCTVDRGDGSGTTVTARLPIGR